MAETYIVYYVGVRTDKMLYICTVLAEPSSRVHVVNYFFKKFLKWFKISSLAIQIFDSLKIRI